ncbi:hypothetical protein MMC10_006801 [Thelotrema lepadinum]|nr:hypothetical protein [Thelotrema lepadinum]
MVTIPSPAPLSKSCDKKQPKTSYVTKMINVTATATAPLNTPTSNITLHAYGKRSENEAETDNKLRKPKKPHHGQKPQNETESKKPSGWFRFLPISLPHVLFSRNEHEAKTDKKTHPDSSSDSGSGLETSTAHNISVAPPLSATTITIEPSGGYKSGLTYYPTTWTTTGEGTTITTVFTTVFTPTHPTKTARSISVSDDESASDSDSSSKTPVQTSIATTSRHGGVTVTKDVTKTTVVIVTASLEARRNLPTRLPRISSSSSSSDSSSDSSADFTSTSTSSSSNTTETSSHRGVTVTKHVTLTTRVGITARDVAAPTDILEASSSSSSSSDSDSDSTTTTSSSSDSDSDSTTTSSSSSSETSVSHSPTTTSTRGGVTVTKHVTLTTWVGVTARDVAAPTHTPKTSSSSSSHTSASTSASSDSHGDGETVNIKIGDNFVTAWADSSISFIYHTVYHSDTTSTSPTTSAEAQSATTSPGYWDTEREF